jgi:hypothetical protein
MLLLLDGKQSIAGVFISTDDTETVGRQGPRPRHGPRPQYTSLEHGNASVRRDRMGRLSANFAGSVVYLPDVRHYWNNASVPVCVASLWNDWRKPKVFTVNLPVHWSLIECVAAPRGDRIAWVLDFSPNSPQTKASPQKQAGRELGLWVSDINGRNMHLIGTVFEKSVPYDNHKGFEYVSWSPAEDKLGFLFQNALWTVPAH